MLSLNLGISNSQRIYHSKSTNEKYIRIKRGIVKAVKKNWQLRISTEIGAQRRSYLAFITR